MTLQGATYAGHQYVTPWGHGVYGNRIVRVRWCVCVCGGGGGVGGGYVVFIPPGTKPWRQTGRGGS